MYRCVRHVVSRAPIHLQPFQPLSPSSPAYLTSRGGKLKDQISKKKEEEEENLPKARDTFVSRAPSSWCWSGQLWW